MHATRTDLHIIQMGLLVQLHTWKLCAATDGSKRRCSLRSRGGRRRSLLHAHSRLTLVLQLFDGRFDARQLFSEPRGLRPFGPCQWDGVLQGLDDFGALVVLRRARLRLHWSGRPSFQSEPSQLHLPLFGQGGDSLVGNTILECPNFSSLRRLRQDRAQKRLLRLVRPMLRLLLPRPIPGTAMRPVRWSARLVVPTTIRAMPFSIQNRFWFQCAAFPSRALPAANATFGCTLRGNSTPSSRLREGSFRVEGYVSKQPHETVTASMRLDSLLRASPWFVCHGNGELMTTKQHNTYNLSSLGVRSNVASESCIPSLLLTLSPPLLLLLVSRSLLTSHRMSFPSPSFLFPRFPLSLSNPPFPPPFPFPQSPSLPPRLPPPTPAPFNLTQKHLSIQPTDLPLPSPLHLPPLRLKRRFCSPNDGAPLRLPPPMCRRRTRCRKEDIADIASPTSQRRFQIRRSFRLNLGPATAGTTTESSLTNQEQRWTFRGTLSQARWKSARSGLPLRPLRR